jgi:hypothetical protein
LASSFRRLTPGILQPKVIDEDVTLASTFLVQPIHDGRSHWLVDSPQDIQSADLVSIFCRLTPGILQPKVIMINATEASVRATDKPRQGELPYAATLFNARSSSSFEISTTNYPSEGLQIHLNRFYDWTAPKTDVGFFSMISQV